VCHAICCCRLALLQFEQLQSKLGQVHTPIGVVQHACQEMVAPVVKEYLKQDKKVVLLEPSAGTGMFTGKLQQLASQYPGRVEVKAYELCQGQATIANALGHTTTGGWNSLVGPALERDTYTGGEPNTKLVVVGNPPYGRQGPAVVSGGAGSTANAYI
jgi:predicted RNA methylase